MVCKTRRHQTIRTVPGQTHSGPQRVPVYCKTCLRGVWTEVVPRPGAGLDQRLPCSSCSVHPSLGRRFIFPGRKRRRRSAKKRRRKSRPRRRRPQPGKMYSEQPLLPVRPLIGSPSIPRGSRWEQVQGQGRVGALGVHMRGRVGGMCIAGFLTDEVCWRVWFGWLQTMSGPRPSARAARSLQSGVAALDKPTRRCSIQWPRAIVWNAMERFVPNNFECGQGLGQ